MTPKHDKRRKIFLNLECSNISHIQPNFAVLIHMIMYTLNVIIVFLNFGKM